MIIFWGDCRMLQDSDHQGETVWQPKAVSEEGAVVSNRALNNEYRHLILSCGPVCAGALPGQFFQLLCPQPAGDKPYLRRPMSIYGTSTDPNRIEFLYKVAGAGTRGLETLQPGDKLGVFGPLGTGFTLDPQLRSIVVVGRGAGLATLAPLARAASQSGIRITAVLSARRPDLLVSVDLFKSHGADVIGVTDQEATSGPANIEKNPARTDRQGCLRRVLHLRFVALDARATALGSRVRHSRPDCHGAANGLRHRPVSLLRARF
jgi:dihydroorotate dehydrogenase electron transfer subunit